MNYYQHHIGDFRSGCIHMSRLERWIYRDMIEHYYDQEKPLSAEFDILCDDLGVQGNDEMAAVSRILRRKFVLTEDGYRHERCDSMIAEYHKKSETAKANGKKGAATRYKNGEYMPDAGTLYAMLIGHGLVKVGVTANLKSRTHQLRQKYGPQMTVLHTVQVSHMGDAEGDLLAIYEESRSGEEVSIGDHGVDALMSHMNRLSVAYQVASGSHTNHKPITINQKPEEQQQCAAAQAVLPIESAAFTLPLNTGDEFPILENQVAEFGKLYPAVDVLQELKKMRGWLVSNPTKRKTKSGMLRFVNGWLSKQQDAGGPPRAPALPQRPAGRPSINAIGGGYGDDADDPFNQLRRA